MCVSVCLSVSVSVSVAVFVPLSVSMSVSVSICCNGMVAGLFRKVEVICKWCMYGCVCVEGGGGGAGCYFQYAVEKNYQSQYLGILNNFQML